MRRGRGRLSGVGKIYSESVRLIARWKKRDRRELTKRGDGMEHDLAREKSTFPVKMYLNSEYTKMAYLQCSIVLLTIATLCEILK